MGDMADFHLESLYMEDQGDEQQCNEEGDKCYACKGTFRLRMNTFEDTFFLGCSNYPKCKATSQLSKQPDKF